MTLANKLRKLEEKAKSIRSQLQHEMTKEEEIAAYGKPLKEMSGQELLNGLFLAPFDEKLFEKLDILPENELVKFCLNSRKN